MKWIVLCLALAACDQVFGLERPPPPVGEWQVIATGALHTCAIRTDATLWCWGANELGQAGAGEVDVVEGPTQISDARWRMVTTLSSSTCGIHEDGTLWCWGANEEGQLGDGTKIPRKTPVQLDGRWQTVSTGARSTCGIRDTGALWCWGGKLGDATSQDSVPIAVGDATGWTAIDVGQHHACGLRDGGMYCWGIVSSALGDPTIATPQLVPLRIDADAWRAVSVAGSHSCGIRDDGRLLCWGYNFRGQIGDASRVTALTPTLVSDDTDWTSVDTGNNRTCAIRGRRAWCWGDNTTGALASEIGELSTVPVEIQHERTWTSISASELHACAIDDNHQLYCAGSRSVGQLGDGVASATEPIELGGSWSSVAMSDRTVCALDSRGVPWCWGTGTEHQIGDGGRQSRQRPVRNGPAGALTIAVGAQHACALYGGGGAQGGVWCWGANTHGQSGDGTLVPSPLPRKLVMVPAAVVKLTSGDFHMCGIDANGRGLCWGSAFSGQLGSSAIMGANPVPLPTTPDFLKAIGPGHRHTCGISPNGGLSCWGVINNTGMMTPLLGIALSIPADRVVAGLLHSCVWQTGGLAACWGNNLYGAIGVPGEVEPGAPVPLTGTWNQLAIGLRHTCGVAADRSLWCWGENADGQLGDGTRINRAAPTQIGTEQGWEMVAAGKRQSCAIKQDGTLWCWGDNSTGELGNGQSWTADLVEVF